ncbi:MAG: hypothetical protein ACLVAW_14490 [Eisenbergiella massiliensis]
MLQDMRAEPVRNRKIIAPLGKAAMAVFAEGVFNADKRKGEEKNGCYFKGWKLRRTGL